MAKKKKQDHDTVKALLYSVEEWEIYLAPGITGEKGGNLTVEDVVPGDPAKGKVIKLKASGGQYLVPSMQNKTQNNKEKFLTVFHLMKNDSTCKPTSPEIPLVAKKRAKKKK